MKQRIKVAVRQLFVYSLGMDTVKVTELISFAKQFIGKPYVYGAAGAEAPEAFDCSSFVQYAFKHIGIELPRSSILQAQDPQGVEVSQADMQPGDVLFMRSDRGYYYDEAFGGRQIGIGHVGIYCGHGTILHSKKSLGGVVLQKLSELQENPNYAIQIVKRFIV
jgi:cell wall-associated NlpC family hydrolase